MTPTRMALHNLAHELHMTVAQMSASMSAREFADWVEWYARRHAEHEERPPPSAASVPGGMHFDLTNAHGVKQLAHAFDKQ